MSKAQERYEEGYGTVLDSGTTFTYLPSDAFQSFKEAVTAFALEHGLKSVKGPDPKVGICGVGDCLCLHVHQLCCLQEAEYTQIDFLLQSHRAHPILP